MQQLHKLLFLLLFVISTGLYADEEDIIRFNDVSQKLSELQEKEKSLKELIELTGTDDKKKDQLDIDEGAQLKQVQDQIKELSTQYNALVAKIKEPVWTLVSTQLNPDGATGETLGDVTKEFKVIDATKCQLHLKKVVQEKDKPKTVADATMTFTFSKMPAVISKSQKFAITVSGNLEGPVDKEMWARASVKGSLGTFTYQGGKDDKNCWVGNLKGGTRSSCQGIYHVTLPTEGESFRIFTGISEIGTMNSAVFAYELKQLQPQSK